MVENAIEQSRRLTVFLKNGVPMKGRIVAHDAYTIFMETDKSQALIYKHSVTSLSPARLKPPPPGARRPERGSRPPAEGQAGPAAPPKPPETSQPT